MSDVILKLIPVSPDFVPSDEARTEAERMLRAMLPTADGVSSTVSDTIEFVDAGGNFESITCPNCNSVVSNEWWSGAMSSAFERQPLSLGVVLPCCEMNSSLNELLYFWPQGFARYILFALNPRTSEFTSDQIAKLAEVTGTALRAVWSRI